jgi:hypothetical protein
LVVARLQDVERHGVICTPVRVVRLDARDDRAEIRLGCGVRSAVAEADIRTDAHRKQDGDDHEDYEQLDQHEAVLLVPKAML